ncbi:MAG: anaerobic glycerol-3-phosphate dehydrogenase subunit GlpB [Syntrophales bacterium]|nr:anaerobic glycerol-3-phosphate dehydrogenase subunit GlpB [Syntrophales bacterium]
MEIVYDVVIIGGGMAGLTAAIRLGQAGLRVAIVSRGDPIVCLSTGCIDVLASGENPLEGVEKLPENHPYHLVDREFIKEALNHFLSVVKEEGLPYDGTWEKNRKVLTPLGVGKTTCLVPETMVASTADGEARLHVISFAGLKDFYPGYILARMPASDLSVLEMGRVSTMSLASRFETEEFLDFFLSWLKSTDIKADLIALPAVLGWQKAPAIKDRLEDELRRPVFEIPTLPPSVPGIRLHRALVRKALRLGTQFYRGRPISTVEKAAQLVEAVTLESPGRPIRVNGRAFILATGSFVGGGLISHRSGVEEVVFHLPVSYPVDRMNWFGEKFLPPEHPIEEAGILVDGEFRPKNTDLENLFVAGSILAHSRVLRYGCGHGLAIVTGEAAASSCLRYLKWQAEGDTCSKTA